MPLTEKQIRLVADMKAALLDAYDPEAIILFGSLGRGDADEFSDVDLLLVMETERNTKELGEEMAEYLNRLAKEKHLVVRTPAEFCRQRDIPGTIVFSADREGQVIFDKGGWRRRHQPVDSYDKRKQEVILKGYIQSAYEFLEQAESDLEKGRLFRFRDFARFAAARAMKALFVQHDTHPPRETDLMELLKQVTAVEEGLACFAAFLRELNSYCPGKADTHESRKSRDLFDRTAGLVAEIVQRCTPDSEVEDAYPVRHIAHGDHPTSFMTKRR